MPDSDRIELASAVEHLYEVFRPYTLAAPPVFCAHCVSETEDSVLRSKPLRELSAQDLSRYSFKALSTWGTIEQFKYLLPRLFEVMVQEGFGYDPEILFKKPRYGDFASWPENEQQALFAYCDALWRYSLAHHLLIDCLPVFADIDDSLCSVA